MPPKVTVRPPEAPQPEQPAAETFRFISRGGTEFICGRPQGVMKLRLRAVLTPEQFADPEIREIAKALLSLRTIGGAPALIRTPEHFEIALAQFGSDEDVDRFMSEWTKFVNPEVFDAVEKALQEGLAKGYAGDKLTEHVQERLAELAAQQIEAVKN